MLQIYVCRKVEALQMTLQCLSKWNNSAIPLAVLMGLLVSVQQLTAGPPDKTFKSAGQLYMARNQGDSADTQTKEVRLTPDPGYMIDLSYQQPTEPPNRFAGGDQQKASSPLHVSDIPKGVYIETGGGWYWSIQPPLRLYGNMDDLSPDGRVQSYTFTARLYCGPEPPPGPGCNAKLDVWFKQKAIPTASKTNKSKKKSQAPS